MIRFEGDRAHIELSQDEYISLIVHLSTAAGAHHKNKELELYYSALRLANSINVGHPDWTPYEVPNANPA